MGKGKEKLGKRAHVKDARQEKANERQERARLRKDRQKNGYYCSDADDKEFEAQVGQIGCRIQFMEGDGNCLFRSLADQLEGRPQDHAAFRAQIMHHLERNREVFEPYMEDDEKFDDYLERMRGDAEWGGNQELVAASRLFKVNIVVHQFKAPRFFIPFEKARRTIHLSYHGDQHYNSVRALGDEGDGPPVPISLQAPVSVAQSQDAKKSAGTSSPWPQQEEVVARSCPWANSSAVVDALKATGGRADDAIELLVAERNQSSVLDRNLGSRKARGGSTENAQGDPGGTSDTRAAVTTPTQRANVATVEGSACVGQASGVSTGSSSSPSGGDKKPRKIARAADCPCGSGVKYKKCCKKKDAAIARGRIRAPAEGSDASALGRESSLAHDLGSLVI